MEVMTIWLFSTIQRNALGLTRSLRAALRLVFWHQCSPSGGSFCVRPRNCSSDLYGFNDSEIDSVLPSVGLCDVPTKNSCEGNA